MNIKYIYSLFCLAAVLLVGCKADEGREVYPFSEPEVSNVNFAVADVEEAGSDISFSLGIKDPLTPLSTLEIELKLEDKVLYTESIRTKGQSAEIKDHVINIPFYADFEKGAAQLKLTAINIEGSEKVEIKNFTIERPAIPATIYLHYEDQVVELHQSEENPYAYATESGAFPERFKGKISTSKTLEDSKFVWTAGDANNATQLGNTESDDFSFDFTDWEVEKVKFNTFTFGLGVEGLSRIIKIKGVALALVDGLYQGAIDFKEGEDIEILGIEDLKGAYNRDFFSYDTSTEKIKFLQASGKWSVYYSVKYNYMWVARMDDVAPTTYWLIGHGVTCASIWHSDYDSKGWGVDDITEMGYMVKIAENKYQVTAYLNDTHAWGNFDIKFYGKRDGDLPVKEMAVFNDSSFSGDAENIGYAGGDKADIVGLDGFVPGYFQITLDISAGLDKAKVHFKRLSN